MQPDFWPYDEQEALNDFLRLSFEADPDAGTLTYRRNIGRHRRGELAGNLAGRKYREGAQHLQIWICGRSFYLHDVLWFLVFGAWAPCDIDHIDRDGTNCRLTNLRLSTRSENIANSPARPNSASGIKGVHRTPTGRWCAQVRYLGRTYTYTFDYVEDAITWRNARARTIWREHDLPAELPLTGEARPRKDFTDIFLRLSREDRTPADGDSTDCASGQLPLPGFAASDGSGPPRGTHAPCGLRRMHRK